MLTLEINGLIQRSPAAVTTVVVEFGTDHYAAAPEEV
jgi:hypothetical protein